MIEVEHLTKYYGTLPAVNDVSFRVEKGEILGFLGPNGAGKTTTMRMLTCYTPASAGTARVAGYDVFENSMEVRRRIGYLPEYPPLYPDMTVSSYLDFVAKIKGVTSENRKGRIEESMARCGVQDVRSTIIGKLSKGYQQRVGLAQAMVHDPEVLVLDEPTIGLDPRQVVEVRRLIRDLAGEHTVILSTHILPEVEMTCERVVIINKGNIVAEDTPENLTARLKGVQTIAVEIEGPPDEVIAKIREIEDVTDVRLDPERAQNVRNRFLVESGVESDVRSALASTIVTSGFHLLELRPVEMRLEDIFIELTTEESDVQHEGPA